MNYRTLNTVLLFAALKHSGLPIRRDRSYSEAMPYKRNPNADPAAQSLGIKGGNANTTAQREARSRNAQAAIAGRKAAAAARRANKALDKCERS